MSQAGAYICPVCESPDHRLFDRRDNVPIFQNRLHDSSDDAKSAPRGDLRMHRCRACGFVWNAAFDAAKIVYDGDYENDQSHSPAFQSHLEEVASRALNLISSGPLRILEVGSGQGGFLERLAETAGERFAGGVGYDPAARAQGEASAGISYVAAYFGPETADSLPFEPNLAISRHTIEHVADPVGFLRSVRAAWGAGGAEARLAVETPDVDWILRTKAAQDFFYEHCSLFTGPSLRLALARAGFTPLSAETLFGGQYLLASGAPAADPALPAMDGESLAVDDWASDRDGFIQHWRARLLAARVNGPVYLWGAGAKGVTFALMTDPGGALTDGVIDINPAKQGKYIAGSALPVLAPEGLPSRPVSIVVMNPNYLDEIAARLGARQDRLISLGD